MGAPQTIVPHAVYHADWGTSPRKRWMARAVLDNGCYTAHAPVQVGDHRTLISRVKADVGATGVALVGFDFPIGIPGAYS
jgi:hypothetical protein